MSHKLIDEVVDQDICIGCGMCAGVCPKSNIQMSWTSAGELVPVINECCGEDVCERLCVAACPVLNPGADQQASETKGQSTEELLIGDYHTAYLGYDTNVAQRQISSSGGLLTWLLIRLLEEKIIDGVITTVASDNPENGLFRFDILRTPDALRKASGSKYYPVEASEVVKRVMKDKTDDTYAILGVPCLLQGVNIAKKKYKRLDRKLRFSFSLVCGQLPNAAYTELLSSCSGLNESDLGTVDYRNKENTTSASNYVFVPEDKSGNKGQPLYWVEQPSYLWENSFFIHTACRFCDDLYGRTADAVFMDAWLPGISQKPEGHSLVVIRDPEIDAVFQQGKAAGLCEISPVSIDDVLTSQRTQIIKKTEMLSAHLYKAEREGIRVTPRAVSPSSQMYTKYAPDIELQWQTRIQSKELWTELKKQGKQSQFFDYAKPIMKKIEKRRRAVYLKQALAKLTRNPFKTFSRVLRHQIGRIIKG